MNWKKNKVLNKLRKKKENLSP